MNRIHKTAVIAASVALAGIASAQAQESSVAIEHRTVFYGDLNLRNDAGAEVLFYRLRHAVEDACGGKPDHRELTRNDNFRTCVRTAMGNAVTRLGNSKLAALVGQKMEQLAERE